MNSVKGIGLGVIFMLLLGGARGYHRFVHHGASAKASQQQAEVSDEIDRMFDDGNRYFDAGQFDAAIKAYTEQLRQYPDDVDAYHNRGLAWLEKRQYRKALSDLNEVLVQTPDDADVFLTRGMIWEDMGDYRNAIADYRKSIELAPDEPWPYNNLAWIFATSPDATYRNGERAVEHAKRYFELGGDRDCVSLDTVAAAFAESGNFQKAVEIQDKAIAVAPEEDRPELQERRELYLDNKPFRSETK